MQKMQASRMPYIGTYITMAKDIKPSINPLAKCQPSVKAESIVLDKKKLSPLRMSPFFHLFFQLMRQSQNCWFLKFLNMETSYLVDKTSIIAFDTHAKSQNIIEIIIQRYKKTRNAKISTTGQTKTKLRQM